MCFSVRMHIQICRAIKGSFYGALQSSELRPNTIVLYVMGKTHGFPQIKVGFSLFSSPFETEWKANCHDNATAWVGKIPSSTKHLGVSQDFVNLKSEKDWREMERSGVESSYRLRWTRTHRRVVVFLLNITGNQLACLSIKTGSKWDSTSLARSFWCEWLRFGDVCQRDVHLLWNKTQLDGYLWCS